MTGIIIDSFNTESSFKRSSSEKDTKIEDFFRDFWSTVDEEEKKRKKLAWGVSPLLSCILGLAPASKSKSTASLYSSVTLPTEDTWCNTVNPDSPLLRLRTVLRS